MSLLPNLGYFALVAALGCAVYAVIMALLSATQKNSIWLASARRAAFLTWPLITLAALTLIALLVGDQYQVEYVSSATSREMPLYLKVTALWGGQAGSIVFWGWLMSTFTGSVMLRRWERDRGLMPYVIAVTNLTLGFFIALSLFIENPFVRLWHDASGQVTSAMFPPAGAFLFTPADGRGLNPLLRHPGMIIHPPMLYLGFVGFVVPYAFAIAALITRRTDDEWIKTTRTWTLVAWLFLSLGLILGGRWAYDVLGWGGYWGWDPVENAAFMPWLTGTAFLHSVMIQEKRGMLKRWNMLLIILTYSLVIFGTFLTRSGVLSSVHAFAQSAIGPWFFTFIALTLLGSLILLAREWERLKADNQLDGLLSRESAFLLNNVLFMGITFSVFWGTVSPMISEVFTGQKISVGPPFYNQVAGPQFAALVLLMGVAPLVAWRKASARQLGRLMLWPFVFSLVVVGVLLAFQVFNGLALLGFWIVALVGATTVMEFARGTLARMRSVGDSFFTAFSHLISRNRRRYGGYIIHLGVVLIAIGIIGSNMFQMTTQGRLAKGQQLSLGRYVLVYDGLAVKTYADREEHWAKLIVYRDGKYLTDLYPRQDLYQSQDGTQPMTIPGVRSALEDDVYAILVNWEAIGVDGATFKIYVNPLINFVWTGGLVFILGMLVASWPSHAEGRRATTLQAAAAQAPAGD